MKTIPGFFNFRWELNTKELFQYRSIAIVFKVPGYTDLSVIPDLVEHVCRGPIVPDAVVLVHLSEDPEAKEIFKSDATQHSLVRFSRRLPLLSLAISLAGGEPVFSLICPNGVADLEKLKALLTRDIEKWILTGLTKIFDPVKIIVSAPKGFTYQKPSQSRAAYFIRAEQGLESSAVISYVAFAIWRRLVQSNFGIPKDLTHLFVDTMGIAPLGYALRELFQLAKVRTPPQIESFHSYGGLEYVKPISSNSLCLISASSSMNLHREWVNTKHVLDKDVLTIISFSDAKGSEFALVNLPARSRPDVQSVSALYDIKIQGENFVPLSDVPRLVLLRKPIHGDEKMVDVFCQLSGRGVFSLFRPISKGSARRRGVYCDGLQLIKNKEFKSFVHATLNQKLRASTKFIFYQDDDASFKLANFFKNQCKKIANLDIKLASFKEAVDNIDDKDAGLLAIAAVAGGGASILSFSRMLRGKHLGPRTYFIGFQLADSTDHIVTFTNNIKMSVHVADIDVVRYGSAAIGRSIEESFQLELDLLIARNSELPTSLSSRVVALRGGDASCSNLSLLAKGDTLNAPLQLRPDFAFWSPKYKEGSHHAEVLATIAALLQRARESSAVPAAHRLHTGSLQHVLLDPENFARFDDGLIQAALLRAALPSELDYRGDKNASGYIRDFLIRISKYLGDDKSEAALEFLSALAIGRLCIDEQDLVLVKAAFLTELENTSQELHLAMRFFAGCLGSSADSKNALPF